MTTCKANNGYKIKTNFLIFLEINWSVLGGNRILAV